MNTQAFASNVPLSPLRYALPFISQSPPPLRGLKSRTTTRACLPSSGDAPSPSAENQMSSGEQEGESVTKTEKIAALLGQNKDTMTESADKVKDQAALDNRNKYGLALLSTAIATSFFFAEKLNPNASVNLLRFLESTSVPLSAVGTNEKPSFIEFGATWCENCKVMAKSVFELESEYAGQINFLVVDGDDPNNADIIERYGVDGIPQFSLLDRSGSVKANLIGRIPKQVLEQDLDALLDNKPMPFPGLSLDELVPPSS